MNLQIFKIIPFLSTMNRSSIYDPCPFQYLVGSLINWFITGVNQKVLPVLSTETLLHIWLSTEYYGFRPSSTAVDTVS